MNKTANVYRREGAMRVYRQAARVDSFPKDTLGAKARREWQEYRRGGATNTPRAAFELGFRMGARAVLKAVQDAAHNVPSF